MKSQEEHGFGKKWEREGEQKKGDKTLKIAPSEKNNT